MTQRTIYSRSSVRLAQELQLQAELEFMQELSKRIKQERNSLQIERLHLENLKLQLQNASTNKDHDKQSLEKLFKESMEAATAATAAKAAQSTMSAVDLMNLGNRQLEDDAAFDEDTQCNKQDLNLNLNFPGPSLSRSGTPNPTLSDFDCESDEDESSSDVEDVVIDMNMFMHGDTSRS